MMVGSHPLHPEEGQSDGEIREGTVKYGVEVQIPVFKLEIIKKKYIMQAIYKTNISFGEMRPTIGRSK